MNLWRGKQKGFYWHVCRIIVSEVKYEPNFSVEYHLQKGRLEEELERFLIDMEALLRAEYPPGQGQESHSK
jgi:hypothetical protein